MKELSNVSNKVLEETLEKMHETDSPLEGVLVALDILGLSHNTEHVDACDIDDTLIDWYVEHDDIYSDYRLLKGCIETELNERTNKID